MPDYGKLNLQSKNSIKFSFVTNSDAEEVIFPMEVIVGTSRRPILVAIAGVHGDEIDGIVALQDFWKEIETSDLSGTLLVVPVANPPAANAGTRYSPDDGQDMNRIIPGKQDGTITEKLAYHIFHEIVLHADLLVTLHGWSHEGITIPYTEIPNGIGDPVVEMASMDAGRAFGFEVLRISPDKAGRMLPEAVRAGIPTIECEIGGLGVGEEDNSRKLRDGLFNLMQHLKMIRGEPSAPAGHHIVRPHDVITPVDGFLRQHVPLNVWVERGQLLSSLCGLNGQVLTEIRAPTRALVASQRKRPSVKRGDRVCTLFLEIHDVI